MNSEKILIIGPSWVGDMMMAQSLFKLLKQHKPDCTIDVLASAWTFALLKRMPEVSQAIPNPLNHGELKLKTRFQLAQQLKSSHYHQAIVLANSFKSTLIPWFARIPKRTGWFGEMRFGVLNDARYLDEKKYPLMVEQYIALGLPARAALPKGYPYPSLSISAEQQQNVLQQHQPIWRNRPILALCAGAEFGPAKRWPINYYAEIANQKLRAGWDVWLFGSPKDKLVTDEIMTLTKHQCENLAGRLPLDHTIDLLSLVSAVVTNDSGLMHIAAALNKPVIALYGSTSPHFTPPLSSQAKILRLNLECQPCFSRECPLKHHRCMQDLLPEHVLTAFAELGL